MAPLRSDTLNGTTASRWKTPGVFIVRAFLFALLLLFVARTWADPDLWGHVKFGGDIAAGGLHTSDPYSFGSNRPWINHEWLAELVMFESWKRGGGPGLIGVKTALVLVLLGFVLAALRKVAMSPGLRLLLLFTVVAGVWARTYVFRPQIFSLVLFAALLWILTCAERGRSRALGVLPIVFALWVNLHGGWIVGLAALGLWTTLNLVFKSAMVPRWQLLTVLAASIAATLLNPYSLGMWEFLFDTVRLERGSIADWQSLLNAGAGKLVAWGTAATLACKAFIHRRPSIPLSHAFLTIGLAAASMKVSRLDAFFSLSVVMLLAPQIAGFAEGKKRGTVPPADAALHWGWAAAIIAGGLLAVLPFRQHFSCVRLDGPWMPEREASTWIKENHLRGRLLVWFDWGEYAIWHFAPDLKVSLDGRRETVYSDQYLSRHTDLYFNPPAQRDFLQELDADHAWLASELPLVSALEDDGWRRLFSGPESVVLSRRVTHLTPTLPSRGVACFPGP